MLYRFLGIIAMAGLAGCAAKPVAEDTTPLNPTAVIERHIVNNGIKGYFPFESDDTSYVRASVRRDEHALKGTGTFSGFLVGSRSSATITRLDRKLLWTLDTEKEQYSECPLKGCADKAAPPAARPGQASRQPQGSGQPEAPREEGCTLRIANSSFTVKPTGQRKTINGFDTEQHLAEWTVALRDKQARTTTSKLSLDLWITPLTQNMRDTMAMEAAYLHNYAGAAPETYRAPLVPDEAAKLMASYLGKSLGASDQAAFLAGMKQLQKIKGYPISSRLTWNMDGKACAPNEPARSTDSGSRQRQMPTSAGGLASGLASMFVEKKAAEAAAEAANEPILSFTVEVRQFKVESRHDSVFEAPAGYKLVQP